MRIGLAESLCVAWGVSLIFVWHIPRARPMDSLLCHFAFVLHLATKSHISSRCLFFFSSAQVRYIGLRYKFIGAYSVDETMVTARSECEKRSSSARYALRDHGKVTDAAAMRWYDALWARITKNTDKTAVLGHSLIHLLVRSHRSLVLFAHSLARGKV